MASLTATVRHTQEDSTPDVDIPVEEERLLARVRAALAERAAENPGTRGGRTAAQYDQELVALRDEIGEARLEDVAALVAQMERLQGVSLRRAEAQAVLVDPQAPYFGHLRLREQVEGRPVVARDVLIGRATFIDPASRVNIVDWRHAPVSQLYYRYTEGSDYEERFGEREVQGEILARRTVTVDGGALLRVACPQGVWTRDGSAQRGWRRDDVAESALAGGEGTAARTTTFSGPLQDRAKTRGVLGAGVNRHQRLDRHLPEIAALIDPRQFELITALRSGVVVIQGGAGSGKTTIGLHRIAYLAFAFPNHYPPKRTLVVTYGSALAAYIGQVLPALGVHGVGVVTFRAWAEKELRLAIPWLRAAMMDDAPAVVTRLKSHPGVLADLERRAAAHVGRRTSRALIDLWAELLTDRGRLGAVAGGDVPNALSPDEIDEAHRFMADRVSAVIERDPANRPPQDERPQAATDDDDVRGDVGIDGQRTDDDQALLDIEDVSILLHAHQLLRGVKRPLAHLFVDEAQDLSPLELSVLINQTTTARSVTLAGDTSQRLFLDNGFGDWRTVLGQLSLSHVAVEPLRIAYRSTRQILEVARHAMGHLADTESVHAPRSGAPVEAHRFPGTGAAVAFLAEALRPLFAREPRATVALLARHPEQADRYYEGLRRAEVPGLSRVRAQNFSFRPGIEVTEIRQVKGLEFDYVVILDANAATFGSDDESRHLFHIGATRAAHQLWLIVTATPSPLVPAAVLSD